MEWLARRNLNFWATMMRNVYEKRRIENETKTEICT